LHSAKPAPPCAAVTLARGWEKLQRNAEGRWLTMRELLFYIVSSFWAGAVHAATPGHGKTIAAAYLVGARGKPIDAVILGVFVTLSHTSGIVLVGVLASLGSAWLVAGQVEMYLALAVGLLIIVLALWMLFMQRHLLALAMGHMITTMPAQTAPGGGDFAAMEGAHDHAHDHDHAHGHTHPHTHSHPHSHTHDHGSQLGLHTHGWGSAHAHQLDLAGDKRPALGALLVLAIAGGILPDPTALAILLAALSSGKVLLGLVTVVVFSLGFAATLVVVGVIAAQVGQKILGWLSGIWAVRIQIATTLFILGMGVVLTVRAIAQIAAST
jgi:nickel/cobalt transporter (NicO) family protein